MQFLFLIAVSGFGRSAYAGAVESSRTPSNMVADKGHHVAWSTLVLLEGSVSICYAGIRMHLTGCLICPQSDCLY